jgi:hypothetical protein
VGDFTLNPLWIFPQKIHPLRAHSGKNTVKTQPSATSVNGTEIAPDGSEVKTMTQTDSQVWFQRIFHPSDISDASNVAFVHALKLVISANGRMTILHTGDGYGQTVGARSSA